MIVLTAYRAGPRLLIRPTAVNRGSWGLKRIHCWIHWRFNTQVGSLLHFPSDCSAAGIAYYHLLNRLLLQNGRQYIHCALFGKPTRLYLMPQPTFDILVSFGHSFALLRGLPIIMYMSAAAKWPTVHSPHLVWKYYIENGIHVPSL